MQINKLDEFNNSKISLNRKILSWEWYTEPNTFKLFIHCLLRANFKDEKYRGILVKRGQFITGRKKLSIETGLTERQIRTAISRLEMTNELTKEKNGSYTVITVNKYNEYQQNYNYKRPTNDQRTTSERPASDQRPTTNNNDNNDNNDNNEYIYNSLLEKDLKNLNDNFSEEKLKFKQYGIYQNVILNDNQKSWLLARIPSEKVLNNFIDELSTSIASARDKQFDFQNLDMHKLRILKYFEWTKKHTKAKNTEEDKKEVIKVATMENYKPF